MITTLRWVQTWFFIYIALSKIRTRHTTQEYWPSSGLGVGGLFAVALQWWKGIPAPERINRYKAIPLQACTGPEGSRRLRVPQFLVNRYMKGVRLPAVRTGRLYPQETSLVFISVKRLSRHQGHSAAGRITSMKNADDPTENQTRDLPT